MTEVDWVKKILEASVQKKGEVPLTNLHLLNILNMAARARDSQDEETNQQLNQMLEEDRRWGK